ncbi:MAG: hypothetical protein LQ340_001257 [Diploschistes diacapsis]|nr:MAG: hypothetical protein LQ340_001257 [Diploschistes diacapsis]
MAVTSIHGVRHKCLSCPDWDYCTTCVKSALHTHPGHRFVPIYEHIAGPVARLVTHHQIRCDGPLCKNKTTYIRGDRYKCAVCNNTDFCAGCEALPSNSHNRTHPMIKLRTPVRNVSVTTFGEKENGESMKTMGDQIPQTISKSTETTPAPSANAATQVQTMAETTPSIKVYETQAKMEETKQEKTEVSTPKPIKNVKIERTSSPAPPTFDAHFVRDAIVDGSKLPADRLVHQVWVLRNPGPLVWPAGCSVKYIGGDNMLNIDSTHPASTSDLDNATQSNAIPQTVAVGEEVCFSVTLKTPNRLGKSISYWRLKTADGIPFGHKLWCDIDVVESEEDRPENKVSESQMIFPTLEKESPASSTVVTEAPEPAPSVSTNDRELEEDLESLGLGDSETDDGFLTDEEYEMLDGETTEEAINGRK